MKCYDHSSAFISEWVLFVLASDKDNNKSLDVCSISARFIN